jgi:hypothetical protein
VPGCELGGVRGGCGVGVQQKQEQQKQSSRSGGLQPGVLGKVCRLRAGLLASSSRSQVCQCRGVTSKQSALARNRSGE